MTCTDKQVIRLKKMIKKNNQEIAAAKSGMTAKTARKYLTANALPSELKKPRYWKTRSNVFSSIWPLIEDMIGKSPGLEGKTILAHLIEKDSTLYKLEHLRTLQRLIRNYRATKGPEKEIIFSQELIAGRQSQSDYTSMNDLSITIANEKFDHLLFHFILPFSRWEHVTISFSESFESLSNGYDLAVFALGGVACEHRTDNLSAAVYFKDGEGYFTSNWQELTDHYGVKPSTNNPGVSHENGSVEKSHDLLKKDINQQLYLRGSRDFSSVKEYKLFLNKLIEKRNSTRKDKIIEEVAHLKNLPERKYSVPVIFDLTVSKFSTVLINGSIYSVPSRLIGHRLRVYSHFDHIKLEFGNQIIQTMPKIIGKKERSINYRHIIHGLIRKPGAFANYAYKDALFPHLAFRKAYDILKETNETSADKNYLQLLHLAAIGSESEVCLAIEMLIEDNIIPMALEVKKLVESKLGITPQIKVQVPRLNDYDSLLQTMH